MRPRWPGGERSRTISLRGTRPSYGPYWTAWTATNARCLAPRMCVPHSNSSPVCTSRPQQAGRCAMALSAPTIRSTTTRPAAPSRERWAGENDQEHRGLPNPPAGDRHVPLRLRKRGRRGREGAVRARESDRQRGRDRLGRRTPHAAVVLRNAGDGDDDDPHVPGTGATGPARDRPVGDALQDAARDRARPEHGTAGRQSGRGYGGARLVRPGSGIALALLPRRELRAE